MKIYLAGPMRGIKDFNFPAFHAAAQHLRELGHEVSSPAEKDLSDGFDPTKDKPKELSEYMVHDLAEVCKAEAVVVLPGWESSQGARLEVMVAMALKKKVLDLDLNPIEDLSILQEADGLVNGDRCASYGPPTQDFKRTADMWTALLQFKLNEGERIRPQDVALMMILLKASRAQHSSKRDNYVDIGGYADCGWKCEKEYSK